MFISGTHLMLRVSIIITASTASLSVMATMATTIAASMVTITTAANLATVTTAVTVTMTTMVAATTATTAITAATVTAVSTLSVMRNNLRIVCGAVGDGGGSITDQHGRRDQQLHDCKDLWWEGKGVGGWV